MRLIRNNMFVVFMFILISLLDAQNLTNQEKLQFYPHTIGNSWKYFWLSTDSLNGYTEAGSDKFVISTDTTINSINYFRFVKNKDTYLQLEYFERTDTLSGDVLRIEDGNLSEMYRVDNVYAGVGDTVSISNNGFLFDCDKLVVLSFRDTVLNGYETTIREVVGLPTNQKMFFAMNIGYLGSGETYWIDSARVNGIVYSDISSDLTDIKDKNVPINRNYMLYQNYPNPFNPITTIPYTLLKPGLVRITLYDVRGRKIKTLVSGNKRNGNYLLHFNGKNLSSGIYYYKMEVNGFI